MSRFANTFVFMLAFAAQAAVAAVAAAQLHSGDIDLDVPVVGGPIVTSGGDWTGTFAGRVFEGVMPASPPYVTEAPGFDSLDGTFPVVPAPAQIRFDFVSQLLYWNGTALTTPTSALTVSFSSQSATVTGSDASGKAGFVIAPVSAQGAFHLHLDYSLPTGAASGLYGAVLSLGPAAGSTGFTTSDPFLITFLQGSVADIPGGMDALVNAAFVPEPSGVGIAGVAAAAAAIYLRRRAARHR